MGLDEDNDDGLGGRSRDRREVTEANRWARPLAALDPVAWAAAPVNDAIREEVELARRLAAAENRLARDRSFRRIDKLVRELEEEEIAAIDAFLARPARARAAAERAVAGWRARLVTEGEPAIRAFGEAFPQADLQRMRQLVRNARKPDAGERAKRQLDEALAVITPQRS
jgi:ribosome-associated protein